MEKQGFQELGVVRGPALFGLQTQQEKEANVPGSSNHGTSLPCRRQQRQYGPGWYPRTHQRALFKKSECRGTSPKHPSFMSKRQRDVLPYTPSDWTVNFPEPGKKERTDSTYWGKLYGQLHSLHAFTYIISTPFYIKNSKIESIFKSHYDKVWLDSLSDFGAQTVKTWF